MDAELLELQREFESAQQAKSSVRLSDRNVVELVHKLQELKFFDFDLLHTVSGKEYITPDRLRLEIEAEVRRLGRVSLIDLSDVVGVDLYHVERQAERIVAEDPRLRLIQGEIVSEEYWDSVAEEVNEKLQECSQIALAEIAAQWHVGSELVVSVLEPRIGSINSYINYDVLLKLSIPQPKQYLQSRYPEGIPLDGVFVHPSLVEMLDAAIEDAVEHGNWIDSLSVLPTYVGAHDVSKILSLCPSVQRAIKSSKAILLGETCMFSSSYVKQMFDQMEKELDTLSYGNSSGQGLPVDLHSGKELKVGLSAGHYSELKETGDEEASTKHVPRKGSNKKKGKLPGSSKTGLIEHDPDSEDIIPTKVKKNQRKIKDTTSQNASETKSGGKKGSDRLKEDTLNIISVEWIMQKIVAIAPDLEELGGQDEPSELLRHLSYHLRPMLIDSLKKRRNTLLLENAERRRRLLDNLQRQLDEAFLEMQLYEKALDLFEDDPPTSVVLHKHLLRTMGTPIVDKLLQTLDIDNKLMNGVEVEDSESLESRPLNPVERASLAKGLPGPQSVKSQAVVEALEGKRVDAFMTALRSIAEESGLHLKKLDKKLERTLLHSYRKDMTSQVSSESDPVVLLPKVVALLYLQTYNKALQAPGRAISAAVVRLKDKVQDKMYKVLMDYHSAIVTLLALQAASTGDEEDCSSDRILSKRELLESKMPELKGLVLQTSSS